MAENDIEKEKPLSTKQQRAVMALVTQDSVAAAAKVARVSERSIHRWQTDLAFRRAVKTASQMLVVSTLNYVRGSKIAAVDTLKDVFSDKSVAAEVRGKLALQYMKILNKDQAITPAWDSSVQDPIEKMLSPTHIELETREDLLDLEEKELKVGQYKLTDLMEQAEKTWDEAGTEKSDLEQERQKLAEERREFEEEKKKFEEENNEEEEDDY